MIISKALQELLKDLSLTYNEYRSDFTVKGSVTKQVMYYWGDNEMLNLWLSKNSNKEQFPLIWYDKKPYTKNTASDKIDVDARIILMTSTKKEYWNDERALLNFEQILMPLADLVVERINESKRVSFADTIITFTDIEKFGLSNDFETATNKNSATTMYIDAKVMEIKLRVQIKSCA